MKDNDYDPLAQLMGVLAKEREDMKNTKIELFKTMAECGAMSCMVIHLLELNLDTKQCLCVKCLGEIFAEKTKKTVIEVAREHMKTMMKTNGERQKCH